MTELRNIIPLTKCHSSTQCHSGLTNCHSGLDPESFTKEKRERYRVEPGMTELRQHHSNNEMSFINECHSGLTNCHSGPDPESFPIEKERDTGLNPV